MVFPLTLFGITALSILRTWPTSWKQNARPSVGSLCRAPVTSFLGHAVGESHADIQALIANVDAFLNAGFSGDVQNTDSAWCSR